MQYSYPVRITLLGDETRASQFVGEARALLGVLMKDLGESNLRSGKRSAQRDGVTVDVLYDGTLAAIQIDVRGESSASGAKIDTTLWVPHGFVVYPANADNRAGWGLPFIPASTYPVPGPYELPNLSPGLSLVRWASGGALGEVLLSKDLDAGYPLRTDLKRKIVAPLLYDRAYGPAPKLSFRLPQLGTLWAAYRIEFVDIEGQSPAPLNAWAGIKRNKRQLFERTNTQRAAIGRDKLQLPIRGLFDMGQMSAEVAFSSQTLAHMSANFPKHWRTAEEQCNHEGALQLVPALTADSRSHNYNQNLVAYTFPPTSAGPNDANGVGSLNMPNGGPPISGDQAFDLLMTSTTHRAAIESTDWDHFNTSLSVGVRNHIATQDFMRHEQWIAGGNRSWRSLHADVPMLTWSGFHSLNLAWETWPCSYISPSTCPVPTDDPLTELTALTDPTDKLFWLRYTYALKQSGTQLPVRSVALDNRIFCRGRCIAIAPHGGYVWAAAIQKFASPDNDKLNVYRLVALVHHDAEQNGTKAYGNTDSLHVWYCDMHGDAVLRANAPAIIRGIYGHEADEGYPWDELENPCSWRDGGIVDVGTTTGAERDMLKYRSQWVFSPDGMKAVCLRDTGKLADYLDIWPTRDIFGDPACWGSTLFVVSPGLPGSAIELTFGGNAFNPLTVSKAWLGVCSTSTTPVTIHTEDIYPGITGGNPVNNYAYDTYADPIAAGYDDAGVLKFAKVVSALPQSSFFDYFDEFSGVSFGSYADPWNNHFTGFINNNMGRNDTSDWLGTLQIMDIADEVVVQTATRAYFEFTFPSGILHYSFSSWESVNWFQTATQFTAVRVWRNGAQIHEQTYAMPDGALLNWQQYAYQGGSTHVAGVILPPSLSSDCMPSYARNAAGDWIFTYLFYPQALVGYCAETSTISAVTVRTEASCLSRGGWSASSFATDAELMAMTQTTGTAPHFLLARAL